MISPDSSQSLSAEGLAPRWISLGLLAFCCLATLGLYAYPLWWPVVKYDDFWIILRSWTWKETWNNLWLPNNEHAMPLGRISTWLFVQIAGPLPRVPLAVGFQGPLALLLAVSLVYLFVNRELGHPWYGLAASAFFGISTVYQQAVNWFAASFSILALDMVLLALLAAQAWKQSGRRHHLVIVIFCCGLAPAWFASGILAGPLCCMYLLDEVWIKRGRPLGRRLCAVMSPLIGTALFLAISLPRTKDAIMHTSHYGNSTALEGFSLKTGLLYTARSLVDNLALGVFGIGDVTLPKTVIVIVLVILAGGAAWWWYRTPKRGLLLLGLAMIFSHYVLLYSARSLWSYDVMTTPTWSRYHLVPHLGLTLFLVGGLTRWQPRLNLHEGGRLTWKQASIVAGLAMILFVIQLPRGLIVNWSLTPLPDGLNIHWHLPIKHLEQQEAFRHIEEVDELCRLHAIKAETARKVLGVFRVPFDDEAENNWQFLRGASEFAHEPFKTEEEARKILRRDLKGKE